LDSSLFVRLQSQAFLLLPISFNVATLLGPGRAPHVHTLSVITTRD